MARTPSTMILELGAQAPAFSLPDYSPGADPSHPVSLDQVASPANKTRPFLIMFLCNHCPFVVHVRGEFARLERDYGHRISIVAINSNSVETHPQDGPDSMRELALELGWRFPFLLDATQEVAKAYHAACTPDFFLFGPVVRERRRLAYRGQLDASRPGNTEPVTGSDLRAAIDAVLANRDVAADQRPSIGCNIKWAPGNEPDYFAGGR